MAKLDQVHGKKWINGLTALGSVLVAYVSAAFFVQVGEWFDLEAKFRYFTGSVQVLALLCGFLFFIYLFRSEAVQKYLNEVFLELTKVVWATRDDTIKLTIGILIGVLITSLILGCVDFVVSKLLGFLYMY